MKLQDELVTLFVAEEVLNITQLAWTGKNKKSIIYQEIVAASLGSRISVTGLVPTYNLAIFSPKKLNENENNWTVHASKSTNERSVSEICFTNL